MQRVITCKCGNQLLVGTAHAGRVIQCPACGQTHQVPTLRGLADLPAAQTVDNVPERSDRSQWKWRGPAMALSLVGLIVSLVTAGYFFRNWYFIDPTVSLSRDGQVIQIRTAADHIQLERQSLQKMGPAELSQFWDQYNSVVLRRPSSPPYKFLSEYVAQSRSSTIQALMFCMVFAVTNGLLWYSARWARR